MPAHKHFFEMTKFRSLQTAKCQGILGVFSLHDLHLTNAMQRQHSAYLWQRNLQSIRSQTFPRERNYSVVLARNILSRVTHVQSGFSKKSRSLILHCCSTREPTNLCGLQQSTSLGREQQRKLVIPTHVHHLGLRDDTLQTMQLSVTRLFIWTEGHTRKSFPISVR